LKKQIRISKSAKKAEIIPGEMSDMDIDMLSLVRKGANKQKIQIYKEDEEGENSPEESEEKGLFNLLKSFFSGERVEKAETEAKQEQGIEKMKEEEVDLKKEEIADIMKQTMEEALKPLNERLDKIEKGDETEQQNNEPEEKPDDKDIKDILKSVVSEALQPIEGRLEQVEKSRGLGRSQESEEEQKQIEKGSDTFEGYFY